MNIWYFITFVIRLITGSIWNNNLCCSIGRSNSNYICSGTKTKWHCLSTTWNMNTTSKIPSSYSSNSIFNVITHWTYIIIISLELCRIEKKSTFSSSNIKIKLTQITSSINWSILVNISNRIIMEYRYYHYLSFLGISSISNKGNISSYSCMF